MQSVDGRKHDTVDRKTRPMEGETLYRIRTEQSPSQKGGRTSWKPSRFEYLVFGVVILGFMLRVTGISFGLPLHLHPDEATQVENARSVLRGQINPGFFRYPSFMIYQLAFIYGIAESMASVLSLGLSNADYYLFARLLSATYGALTIGAVYLLGRVIVDRSVGMIAGSLLAISPDHIRESHYATVDVAMVFWSVLAMALVIWAIDRGERMKLYLAGIAAGLALSSKYSAIYILPSMFGAIGWAIWTADAGQRKPQTRVSTRVLFIVLGAFMLLLFLCFPKARVIEALRTWTTDGIIEREYLGLFDRILVLGSLGGAGLMLFGIFSLRTHWIQRLQACMIDRRFLGTGAIIVGTFAVTSPFVLLDLPHSARDIMYEYRHVSIGSAAHFSQNDPIVNTVKPKGAFPEPSYYWDWWWRQHGWIVSILVLAGVTVLLRKDSRAVAVTGPVVLLLFLSLTAAGNKADRYALLSLPLLYVFAGAAIGAMSNVRFGGASNFLQIAVLGAACVIPVQSTVDVFRREFVHPETRELAYQWLMEHGEPGSTMVREAYTPDIETVPTPFHVLAFQRSVFDSTSLEQWHDAGVRYFIIGRMRTWFEENASYYPFQAQNYRLLVERAHLLQEFKASEDVSGSSIWIYRIE